MMIVVNGYNYKPFDVPGDGNCMFHSICRHEYFEKSNYDHKRLRKEMVEGCASEVNRNQLFRRHLEDKLLNNRENETVKHYLHRMGRLGEWAGEFECLLITYLFPEVNILVIRNGRERDSFYVHANSRLQLFSSKLITKEEKRADHQICILFHDMSKPYGTPTLFSDIPNHFLFLHQGEQAKPASKPVKEKRPILVIELGDSDDDTGMKEYYIDSVEQKREGMLLFDICEMIFSQVNILNEPSLNLPQQRTRVLKEGATP